MKQGVLLYLPFPAVREDTVASKDFEEWIIKNVFGCMRFAEERGLGVGGMEDIIIVTGRHLARSWVRAIFSESQGGTEVTFVAQVSENSVVHLEERNMSGAQLELGPKGEVGFCITLKAELRNESDTTHIRIYQKINAYSFEVTTSSVF